MKQRNPIDGSHSGNPVLRYPNLDKRSSYAVHVLKHPVHHQQPYHWNFFTSDTAILLSNELFFEVGVCESAQIAL
eukprot:IDg17389t1